MGLLPVFEELTQAQYISLIDGLEQLRAHSALYAQHVIIK